ncbi:MAG TPA: prepilin-type N-terminal cleavage/methylation domain-containing protein [Acidimicrobiales bacterium]|nr:prepilin-type N-terminal cleavage/methylation domain-containing protein [Acidimicrobiales bacterium]
MFEQLKKARSEESGFTLIELLIVIIILAILAAIVIFAVGSTGKNSAAAACKADAKSIETALEAYKAQNNSTYPTAMGQLTSSVANGAPYLREIPGSSHYTIGIDTNGNVLVGTAGGTPSDNFTGNPGVCDNDAK